MDRKIIWTSEITDKDLNAARKNLIENGYKDPSEEEIWGEAQEMNEIWFEDEVYGNLRKIEFPGEIFLMGTLVRWNGAHSAYKNLETRILSEALTNAVRSFEGDNQITLYIEDGTLKIEQYGHDNPTSPSVFEFRSTAGGYEIFDYMVDECGDDSDVIHKYSIPIADEICKTYGWEVAVA